MPRTSVQAARSPTNLSPTALESLISQCMSPRISAPADASQETVLDLTHLDYLPDPSDELLKPDTAMGSFPSTRMDSNTTDLKDTVSPASHFLALLILTARLC
jgi:hypothetical protein